MVKINGSSFALQYKRTTYRPIDSSSVFDTIEDARVYARNTDAEAYFPYAGQLVSTLENGGPSTSCRRTTAYRRPTGRGTSSLTL